MARDKWLFMTKEYSVLSVRCRGCGKIYYLQPTQIKALHKKLTKMLAQNKKMYYPTRSRAEEAEI